MQSFVQGAVVRVPLACRTAVPDTQLPPAAIVLFAKPGARIWVAPIDDVGGKLGEGDVPFKSTEHAGLERPSMVRTMTIKTVDANKAAVIGRLNATMTLAVLHEVRHRMGF